MPSTARYHSGNWTTILESTRPGLWRLESLTALDGKTPQVLGAPQVVGTPNGPARAFDGRQDGLVVPTLPVAGAAGLANNAGSANNRRASNNGAVIRRLDPRLHALGRREDLDCRSRPAMITLVS